MSSPDFRVDNHGSVCILFALTPGAVTWVNDNLPDDAQTWGRNGTVVEPRYIGPIVGGIEGDGLEVQS